MADNAVEAVAAVTAQAVETAVEQATAVTAAAVAGAETALAVADERVERAEATAQAVVDAALQSEIGRTVSAAIEEMRTWHGELRTALATVQDQTMILQAKLETHTSDMTIHTPIAVLPPVVVTEPSISPVSPPTVTGEAVAIVDPLDAPVPIAVESVVPASNQSRRKRLL